MKPRAMRRGFSLVELTLALGLAVFCLIAIFGLLPVGMSASRDAIEVTTATSILSTVAADLRATPSTQPAGATATSMRFGITIPANPVAAPNVQTLYFDDSNQFSSQATGKRQRLTVTFLTNSAARSATCVNLKVSWPAALSPTNAAVGSVQTFVALDRN